MSDPRKNWMQEQTALRNLLEGANPQPQGLEIALSQHARMHARSMSGTESWSYADEVLEGLSESGWRLIPAQGEHSIAWMVWHIARIEDAAMNLLVAGQPQVFERGGWQSRIGAIPRSSGNELDPAAIQALSEGLDINELQGYRTAVGRQTRQILQGLKLEDLKQKVAPERIEQVLQTGAIDHEAREITDYWSKRTIAGLVLMPATRHNFVHLNEAAAQRKRLQGRGHSR